MPAERGVFRMPQRGGNFLLGQVRPIVPFDQQRDTPAFVDMTRPTKRVIERIELSVLNSL
jgi:hypothetical protein